MFTINETVAVQMDWKETSKSHIFKIDLPGFTKDQIKLHLQDGRVLEISGERNEEEPADHDEKKGTEKWHCKERITRGRFSRRFRLPENAKKNLNDDDGGQIKAAFEDGVLTIIVPKEEDDDQNINNNHGANNKKSSKIRAVEISGGDDDDDHDGHTSSKGLSRFVCCKA
ncbi:Alpha crystallin/Hsp20 domain [Macleaya cordata]|uniref:Alpha crystallin/Hsp20 domain n=1 Tax=Macleaya cordata TaxID=56857 RepID=A0A200QXL3_MACCD|nr:Alpha crystallin/Hsp20 domain [Macleaya cordata]